MGWFVNEVWAKSCSQQMHDEYRARGVGESRGERENSVPRAFPNTARMPYITQAPATAMQARLRGILSFLAFKQILVIVKHLCGPSSFLVNSYGCGDKL